MHLLGTRYLRGVGSAQPMVLYYAMFWIGRTVFAHSGGQYFADGLKLSDYGPVRRGSAARLMLLVCLLAMPLAFYYQLDLAYRFGQAPQLPLPPDGGGAGHALQRCQPLLGALPDRE